MRTFLWRIFVNLGLIIIALGLLFGGIAILNTQVPFWSIVYGVMAISLGILLSVISFNEIVLNRNPKVTEYHQIACRVCQKSTLVPFLITSTVCSECQYKMALRLQTAVLIFFVIVALPVTFHLVKSQQNIIQEATTQDSIQCESYYFTPSFCGCGQWTKQFKCDDGEFSRRCGGQDYCCSPQDSSWKCDLRK